MASSSPAERARHRGRRGTGSSLLMLDRGFVAGCANVTELDPACAGMPIVTSCLDRRIDAAMSNSFGFGGTNASLIFRRI
jgi:3-oxoacyl-[acyl-carrier-protein] synthase-1